ncbi:sulfotransferase family 2 domain-containing protein [Palleronia sp.]|uniref:sulfotransferase family 2 domain-containing protein n=1 Tax=Palleronia sp. TaxID=1940284 RepID=UPI0035C81D6F
MIISPGRGYIFVHVPKTGGTSVALALEARAMKDDILIGDTPKARRRRDRVAKLKAHRRLWKHSRLSDLDGLLAPEQIHAMRVVTIVRNPWDRMVSYYFWLRRQSFDHPAVGRAHAMPFDAFLRQPETGAEIAADQIDDYLRLADGTLPRATILRQENLAEDLAAFAAEIGIAVELPHENLSERPSDWRGLYDADTAEIVARAYADDISRYALTFS